MCCWIGVGPPCPTRPPHQQGTELVDELEDFGVVVFSQSAISGTMVHGYHGTMKLPPTPTRGSLPPLSSSGGWTGNLPMLLLLSLCCRRFLVGDVLVMCWRLSRSLCCRRVWRCAGDVLAATAVWRCAGLVVLSLLVSLMLLKCLWRAMVSSSSRSMNMSTIVKEEVPDQSNVHD